MMDIMQSPSLLASVNEREKRTNIVILTVTVIAVSYSWVHLAIY